MSAGKRWSELSETARKEARAIHKGSAWLRLRETYDLSGRTARVMLRLGGTPKAVHDAGREKILETDEAGVAVLGELAQLLEARGMPLPPRRCPTCGQPWKEKP